MDYIEYIKQNKYYVIIASMILASVFANIAIGQVLYFLAMIVMSYKNYHQKERINSLFAMLYIWCFITLVINFNFDYRILTFGLISMSVMPLFSSPVCYEYRSKMLYTLLMILPIVSLLNLYAYWTGINYYALLEKDFSGTYFSGFLYHPMWLGAIIGASNVSILYLYYNSNAEKKWWRLVIVLLLLGSIYLSVVAASRAALVASLVSMAVLVLIYSENTSHFLKQIFLIVLFVSVFLPFYKSGSNTLMGKMESQSLNINSRNSLWESRLDEFSDSPIWGVGFATIKSHGKLITGTVETGSGWLSILSQTGIIGFFLVFSILKKGYISYKEVRQSNPCVILFYCEFLYFALHSVFEGYVFTAGYCPCMIFWLILGFFYEYHLYGAPEIEEINS